MKISFEFKDLRDMMTDLPRFMSLVGSDKPFEERLMEALPPDPHTLTIKVTPKDGVSFTEKEKQAITQALTDFVKDPEGFMDKAKKAAGEKKDALAGAMNPPEEPAKKTAPAAEPAAKEEAKESPAKEEKPAEEPTAKQSGVSEVEAPKQEATPDITEVRKVLHAVIKAGHRDEVKDLLAKLGAANVTSLDPGKYTEFIEEAKKIGGIQ